MLKWWKKKEPEKKEIQIEQYVKKEELVSCSVCGCLLYNLKAHREVKAEEANFFDLMFTMSPIETHKLVYTFYCQAHEPGKNKKEDEAAGKKKQAGGKK